MTNTFIPTTISYKKRAKNDTFFIEIAHTLRPVWYAPEIFESNWCLYCKIFSNHPLFEKLLAVQAFDYSGAQDVINFPFHGGVTYVQHTLTYNLKRELEVGNITVGCDYQHYGDDWYQQVLTLEDNYRIQEDALALEEYLLSFGKVEKESIIKPIDPYTGTDTTAVLAIPLIEEKDINNEAS